MNNQFLFNPVIKNRIISDPMLKELLFSNPTIKELAGHIWEEEKENSLR